MPKSDPMSFRYKITYSVPVRTSWLGWDYPTYDEYAKTKEDLDILVACIMEDARIDRAFYEDIASGKITHLKAHYKPWKPWEVYPSR